MRNERRRMYDHGLGLDANVRSMRKPNKKKNRITPALAHARLIEAANGTSTIIKMRNDDKDNRDATHGIEAWEAVVFRREHDAQNPNSVRSGYRYNLYTPKGLILTHNL